jgi:DNA-binding transcriptional ArsR family regulator
MLPVTALTSTTVAAAMLDPTRLAILDQLREPGSAASVASRLGVPRQRIGYHVRELERAGLVAPVAERAHGGLIERVVQSSAAGYIVAPQALGPVAPDPATITDRFSTAYQLAVASRIIRDVCELRARADRTRKTVPTLTLDTRVRVASADAQQAFATELANAVARVVEKYHDDRSPNGRTFACAVSVHPHVIIADPGAAS